MTRSAPADRLRILLAFVVAIVVVVVVLALLR